MDQSGRLPALFLGCGLALAVVAGLFYLRRDAEPIGSRVADSGSAAVLPPDPLPELVVEPEQPDEDPDVVLKETRILPGDPDPRVLVEQIGRALEAGDMKRAESLIGDEVLQPAQRDRLRELAADAKIRLRDPGPVREVGEIELNRLSRWALEFDGSGGGPERVLFDLRRKDGRWLVERVVMPEGDGGPPRAMLADSLGIADLFLLAVLRQDFKLARAFVDSSQVSDAKIAGLCIIFEEGDYHLRQSRPLRRLFERNGTAGFLANVEAADGSQAAQFGLTMKMPDPMQPWQVTEINLDSLLADFADRVAGGDIYYTPLVRNPKGGDTLVLYFEFDEDGLSPRTARQLEIVSMILRSDSSKKLTISGHTDSLGTENYNELLSDRRARTVSEYLAAAGVAPEQIITEAKGQKEPRRPNVMEDGTDNPLGRRANRRTEIYLDF